LEYTTYNTVPHINAFQYMAEELIVTASTNKKEKYDTLIPQLESLINEEPDLIANLSNVAAALKQTLNFFWVGFYIVRDNQLVLGPFQGPIACTRINFGKGVCGTSWKEKRTIVVPNVDEFPGHIACSSASRSEIVLPAFKNGEVFLVLDVDSDLLNDFDATDQQALEKITKLVERLL
jgi:L-methionine (R)-S-oxide reductase